MFFNEICNSFPTKMQYIESFVVESLRNARRLIEATTTATGNVGKVGPMFPGPAVPVSEIPYGRRISMAMFPGIFCCRCLLASNKNSLHNLLL
jgi:hypothetical protein